MMTLCPGSVARRVDAEGAACPATCKTCHSDRGCAPTDAIESRTPAECDHAGGEWCGPAPPTTAPKGPKSTTAGTSKTPTDQALAKATASAFKCPPSCFYCYSKQALCSPPNVNKAQCDGMIGSLWCGARYACGSSCQTCMTAEGCVVSSLPAGQTSSACSAAKGTWCLGAEMAAKKPSVDQAAAATKAKKPSTEAPPAAPAASGQAPAASACPTADASGERSSCSSTRRSGFASAREPGIPHQKLE